MSEVGRCSRISLYVILYLMALFLMAVEYWQIQVLRGMHMVNPGTVNNADDYHEQHILYGMAWADLLLGIPIMIMAFTFWFSGDITIAHYLFSLIAFWCVYTDLAMTTTSLKYSITKQQHDNDNDERINNFGLWFITYPFGLLLGISYFIWLFFHFDYAILMSSSERAERNSYSTITKEWWESASGW